MSDQHVKHPGQAGRASEGVGKRAKQTAEESLEEAGEEAGRLAKRAKQTVDETTPTPKIPEGVGEGRLCRETDIVETLTQNVMEVFANDAGDGRLRREKDVAETLIGGIKDILVRDADQIAHEIFGSLDQRGRGHGQLFEREATIATKLVENAKHIAYGIIEHFGIGSEESSQRGKETAPELRTARRITSGMKPYKDGQGNEKSGPSKQQGHALAMHEKMDNIRASKGSGSDNGGSEDDKPAGVVLFWGTANTTVLKVYSALGLGAYLASPHAIQVHITGPWDGAPSGTRSAATELHWIGSYTCERELDDVRAISIDWCEPVDTDDKRAKAREQHVKEIEAMFPGFHMCRWWAADDQDDKITKHYVLEEDDGASSTDDDDTNSDHSGDGRAKGSQGNPIQA